MLVFDIRQEEREPIEVKGGVIECAESFQYLGSLIMNDGKIDEEIDKHIAKASRVFGAVLLYGGECWTPLKRHVRKLDVFHHQCLQTVLGITRWKQFSPNNIRGVMLNQQN